MLSDYFEILSNPFGILPDSREAFEAFLDIPVSTFSIILGVLFWGFLLWVPLKLIDRRDQIAGITYSLYMTFSGTILILVLGNSTHDFSNIFTYLLMTLVMFLVAKFRWINRRDKQKAFKEVSTEEAA